MPTSEDYRQMANRAAQIAIACSALSVAGASDPRGTYRSLRVSIPGRMACRLALRRCASKEAEPLSHSRMVLR